MKPRLSINITMLCEATSVAALLAMLRYDFTGAGDRARRTQKLIRPKRSSRMRMATKHEPRSDTPTYFGATRVQAFKMITHITELHDRAK